MIAASASVPAGSVSRCHALMSGIARAGAGAGLGGELAQIDVADERLERAGTGGRADPRLARARGELDLQHDVDVDATCSAPAIESCVVDALSAPAAISCCLSKCATIEPSGNVRGGSAGATPRIFRSAGVTPAVSVTVTGT